MVVRQSLKTSQNVRISGRGACPAPCSKNNGCSVRRGLFDPVQRGNWTVVAEQLSEYLSVTLLVPNATDDITSRDYDMIAGNLRRATGTLGNFEVTIDALQQLDPTGHGTHEWSASRQGGQSHCDIILDLRGGTPLFPYTKSAMGTSGPMHPTHPLWPRRYFGRRTWWVHLKKPCSSKQNPAYAPIHAHEICLF